MKKILLSVAILISASSKASEDGITEYVTKAFWANEKLAARIPQLKETNTLQVTEITERALKWMNENRETTVRCGLRIMMLREYFKALRALQTAGAKEESDKENLKTLAIKIGDRAGEQVAELAPDLLRFVGAILKTEHPKCNEVALLQN